MKNPHPNSRHLATLALLLATPLSLHAQKPEPPTEKAARHFITMIYAHEAVASASIFEYTQVFTPSLTALVESDRHRPNHQPARLDLDPLCNCQDSSGLTLTTDSLSVQENRAEAELALILHNRERRHIHLIFVWTESTGWRVDNISTSDTPDLRSFLLK